MKSKVYFGYHHRELSRGRYRRAVKGEDPAETAPEVGATLGQERFLAEIRLAAALQHPTCAIATMNVAPHDGPR